MASTTKKADVVRSANPAESSVPPKVAEAAGSPNTADRPTMRKHPRLLVFFVVLYSLWVIALVALAVWISAR